jgi:shikimate dehydrogenase
MKSQNRKFGLVGYPLGHSYSKGHFANKFNLEGLTHHSYENFEIQSAGFILDVVKENPDLIGLNVTIPYKQSIIPYLDQIDQEASIIGAVNTIRITHSNQRAFLSGYNTDTIGFTKSLNRWKLESSIKALVMGTGGSSLAVKYALGQLSIPFLSVSRNPGEDFITYSRISRNIVSEYLLWINCTPVGMFPQVDQKLPLPFELLTDQHYLFDLVYNPEITGFLKMGQEAGAKTMNGSIMLYEQAEASWKIWNRIS